MHTNAHVAAAGLVDFASWSLMLAQLKKTTVMFFVQSVFTLALESMSVSVTLDTRQQTVLKTAEHHRSAHLLHA